MFFLKWALKNLYRNKWRSISLLLLTIITTSIFFMSSALLRGSRLQMNESLRFYNGDILIKSKGEFKNISELSDTLNIVRKNGYGFDIIDFCEIKSSVITKDAYETAKFIGASRLFYEYINDYVKWLSEIRPLTTNTVVLEKKFAEKLGLKINDYFNIRAINQYGAINSLSLKVHNIFRGNKFEHNGKIYTNLETAQRLSLIDNCVNRIQIYFPDERKEIELSDRLSDFSEDIFVWYKEAAFNNHIFYKIFNFSSNFLTIIIGFVVIVLLLVQFFAIQNAFYLIFNDRKNEITVLSTYGMPPIDLFNIVAFESSFLILVGSILGWILGVLVGNLLSTIDIVNYMTDIVAVLGGTRLKFIFIPIDFIIILALVWINGLVSSFSALRRYLKSEVFEMQRGI